ncbi:MAG: hypothetical protein QUU85_11500, partial [Candidatus Eisenbacteria bacterium]|nr:hypothetical protein [Candidatus Eisenbacteria bacterium]
MIVAGYALVALIVLMSLLYVPIAADIRPLAGPDSMALAGPFFLSVGRWILLAVVLVLAASRGGFPWIHRSAGVQALAVLVLLACVAGLELWSIVSATSGWYGKPARIWVAAFAVVAPLVLAYFAAVALRGPSHA